MKRWLEAKGAAKMRKFVLFAFLVGGMVGAGEAQMREMPKEVKEFLENYTKDSTAGLGPLMMRRHFDDSIQIQDLKLRAIEVYAIKRNISINSYPDTVELDKIIESTRTWRVLVTAHNKPLYELDLVVEKNGPRFNGATVPARNSVLRHPMWDSLQKNYPASRGINPILITTDNLFYTKGDEFLYFKQKGPRKVYYNRYENSDKELEKILPASIEALDDSKKLVQHWKKHGIPKPRGYISADESIKMEKAKNAESLGVKSTGSDYFVAHPDSNRKVDGNIRLRDVTSPEGGR